MARIFISYRHEASAGIWVSGLVRELRKHFPADQVFQDIASIEPGADFKETLDKALATAGVMLPVIDPRWLSAADKQGRRRLDLPEDWVRQEIAESLRRPGVRVFPLLVDGAQMPSEEDLPDPLKPLHRRQAFEITWRHWDNDVAELVKMLKRVPGLSGDRREGEPDIRETAGQEAQHSDSEARAAQEEAERTAAEQRARESAEEQARRKVEDEERRKVVDEAQRRAEAAAQRDAAAEETPTKTAAKEPRKAADEEVRSPATVEPPGGSDHATATVVQAPPAGRRLWIWGTAAFAAALVALVSAALLLWQQHPAPQPPPREPPVTATVPESTAPGAPQTAKRRVKKPTAPGSLFDLELDGKWELVEMMEKDQKSNKQLVVTLAHVGDMLKISLPTPEASLRERLSLAVMPNQMTLAFLDSDGRIGARCLLNREPTQEPGKWRTECFQVDRSNAEKTMGQGWIQISDDWRRFDGEFTDLTKKEPPSRYYMTVGPDGREWEGGWGAIGQPPALTARFRKQ